jgi:hypothetical protein
MSRPKTGTVVAYSSAANAGIILAPDGVRYVFERRNCELESAPSAGDVVLFEPSRDGYAVHVKTLRRKSG